MQLNAQGYNGSKKNLFYISHCKVYAGKTKEKSLVSQISEYNPRIIEFVRYIQIIAEVKDKIIYLLKRHEYCNVDEKLFQSNLFNILKQVHATKTIKEFHNFYDYGWHAQRESI